MDLGLTGKRAAVAASTAGLGYATAKALIDAGVRVAICGRHTDGVDKAVASLGGDTIGLTVDVGSAQGGRQFVEEAAEALGGVDILVANAGGPTRGGFSDIPMEAYAQALELNLLSVVGMCTAAVPGMQSQGWGRIIGITSVTVRQPIVSMILSNTARAGATGFLKTLALEVAADGVTVNSVQPGGHDTQRLRPVHRGPDAGADNGPPRHIGRPDDFGSVVAFLCSDQARFITGAAIPIDGGANRSLQ